MLTMMALMPTPEHQPLEDALAEQILVLVHPEYHFTLARLVCMLRILLPQHLAIELDDSLDLAPLLLHERVVLRQPAEPVEHVQRILFTILAHEPAWREREEEDTDAQEDTSNDLEQEGEPPGDITVDVLRAVVDPKADEDADGDSQLLEGDEGAADLRRGNLGLIEGAGSACSFSVMKVIDKHNQYLHDHTQHADPQPSDDSPRKQVPHILRATLQRSADAEHNRGDDNGVLPANLVGEIAVYQGAGPAPKFQDRDDETLGHCRKHKGVLEVRHDEDARNNALVVCGWLGMFV
ncbi:hypothetical protein BC936DRAFT_138834 [Jimgerdemannia flammicorona]|uniref:Uncharacterized protein n=1 Tax=Jimgerdemannia flammicorona TaxID=994334 RepID=A0A433BGL4_9FUNG|nr:hypothetical protein BC936DRAFT_138834 [Jimgerdemannia flammicorona]